MLQGPGLRPSSLSDQREGPLTGQAEALSVAASCGCEAGRASTELGEVCPWATPCGPKPGVL